MNFKLMVVAFVLIVKATNAYEKNSNHIQVIEPVSIEPSIFSVLHPHYDQVWIMFSDPRNFIQILKIKSIRFQAASRYWGFNFVALLRHPISQFLMPRLLIFVEYLAYYIYLGGYLAARGFCSLVPICKLTFGAMPFLNLKEIVFDYSTN